MARSVAQINNRVKYQLLSVGTVAPVQWSDVERGIAKHVTAGNYMGWHLKYEAALNQWLSELS